MSPMICFTFAGIGSVQRPRLKTVTSCPRQALGVDAGVGDFAGAADVEGFHFPVL